MTKIILHTDGIRCAFCGKPKREVLHLIAAPEGYAICNECITVSIGLIALEIGVRPSQVYGVLILRQAQQRAKSK